MNLQKLLLDSGRWLILDFEGNCNWEAEIMLESICKKYGQHKTIDATVFGKEVRYQIDEAQWNNEEFWKDITLWQLKY